MNCPKCDFKLNPVTELIDIGVGNQEYLLAWECTPDCGTIISVCTGCGVVDGEACRPWCPFAPEEHGSASEAFDKGETGHF